MPLEYIRRVSDVKVEVQVETPLVPETWWYRYDQTLGKSGLTVSARSVVDLDSDYIVKNGIFGAGTPDEEINTWPVTRLRRGLVMGSVQSGKTASLLAVTAKALDNGVDIIVILAGTRTALWRQTYERVISQLDGWSLTNDHVRRKQRVILPSPALMLEGAVIPDLENLYFESPNRIKKMLSDGRPLISVVMKHSDHLLRYAKQLHDIVEGAIHRSGRSIQMLVIDDEADDGSILDSVVENGMAPDSDGLKQIPRHIARLWCGSQSPHTTLFPKFFATYLAYTATPQANFCQSDHNPLSPKDFISALRVPLDVGLVLPPRSSTYEEPLGVGKYYSGGELFYRRLAGKPGKICDTRKFPVRQDFTSTQDFEDAVANASSDLLSEALRAYFISGVIRLLHGRRSIVAARTAMPDTRESILKISPSPHTMLFHPSARIDTHFRAAEEIVSWSSEFGNALDVIGTRLDSDSIFQMDVQGLIARLEQEEDQWLKWLIDFENTREHLSFMPVGHVYPKTDESHWNEIKKLLKEEIFPHTRLVVINSDPRADDRPHFDPELVGEGKYISARDIYSIFISGNVMARGITLEGLSTTLFLRSANDPLADTQMQMQRWFGYRGSHLCWCRVFMFEDQLNFFRSYHENDEALRRGVIHEMNVTPGSAPGPLVLQGIDFRATGKIANLRALPLCPGADPFVRPIEHGIYAEHNSNVLSNLLENNQWNDLIVGGLVRGTAMTSQLDLVQVAELLESFRYSEHDPDVNATIHKRWQFLASQNSVIEPEAPFFRPPNVNLSHPELVGPSACPYSIAAYLRLWNSLLTRRARGIIPTDDRTAFWSTIDLAQYVKSAPKFYVGVRYGSGGFSKNTRLKAAGIQTMERFSDMGILMSRWGSRNPGSAPDSYLGDQLFDYHIHDEMPPQRVADEPLWRKRGAPGLVLFHVIKGKEYELDAVTMGIAIPLGGPDHMAALRQ